MIKILPWAVVIMMVVQSAAPQSECTLEQTTRVWSPATPAVVKTRVEPSWPMSALNDFKGVILLDVWIDESGNVSCVKITRSSPRNDQAAADAMRQWKFVPATLGGRPIAVVQQVPVRRGA